MDKDVVLKHLGAAASGFLASAGGVLMSNMQAPARQIIVSGILGALTALGWLRVAPTANAADASVPESPKK